MEDRDSDDISDSDLPPPPPTIQQHLALTAAEYATESSYFTRPNRYFGPSSTWRAWTEQERAVVSSLDKVRASSLSIHLYNAYALKRRAEGHHADSKRKGKRRARSVSAELSHDDSDLEIIKPPRNWAAWPLPPEDVPRNHLPNQKGIRSSHPSQPSTDLQESIMASTLRSARARWEARSWDDEGGASGISKSKDQTESSVNDVEDLSLIHLEDVESTDSEAAPDLPPDVKTFSSQAFAQSNSTESDDDDTTSKNSESKPVFTADDDHASRFLLPSTRHVLSKVDEILLALHKTRRVYALGRRSRSRSTGTSAGDFTDHDGIDLVGPQYRGRKRKRKSSNVDIPTDTPEAGSSHSRSRSKAPISTTVPYHLRDWSEILGMAAITGWNTDVVARAGERCANLFGENMLFRTFDENDVIANANSQFDEWLVVDDDNEEDEDDARSVTEGGRTGALDAGNQLHVETALSRTSEACDRCKRKKLRCETLQKSHTASDVSEAEEQTKADHKSFPTSCSSCLLSHKDCSGITVKSAPLPETLSEPALPRSKACPYPSCWRYTKPFSKKYHLQRHLDSVHHSASSPIKSSFGALHQANSPSRSSPLRASLSTSDVLHCPIPSCPRYARPFNRAGGLYVHLRNIHPDVDVNVVRFHINQRKPSKRGQYSRSGSRTRSGVRQVIDVSEDEEDPGGIEGDADSGEGDDEDSGREEDISRKSSVGEQAPGPDDDVDMDSEYEEQSSGKDDGKIQALNSSRSEGSGS